MVKIIMYICTFLNIFIGLCEYVDFQLNVCLFVNLSLVFGLCVFPLPLHPSSHYTLLGFRPEISWDRSFYSQLTLYLSPEEQEELNTHFRRYSEGEERI